MATDLAEQLKRIGHKAELLTTRYKALEQVRQELERKVEQLEEELRVERINSQHLRLEVEHLRLSAAIAPDTEAAARARAYLSDLVREIDTCVEDLMRDI